MCSIGGSYNLSEVSKMLRTMKHRSPDEVGIEECGGFFMGMGRLKIIDLQSQGLCPYKENGVVLSFNGEIYNYIELREELKLKGYHFTTDSDTEVLLKSYLAWGIKCLDKLNGMFAFAINDGKRIFLARDIAGEKPLYYSLNTFRFASEAKALNWQCHELQPAYYLIYNLKSKKVVIKKYWNFKPKIRYKDFDKAVIELERLLEDSIKIRTRSDVPYALYFSGGIDSTLISTFHDFKHKFTYRDGNYKNEFKKLFKKITWHLDYPISSFSSFGLWKLAEKSSKKVKVVISGEGADELFGGYVRYIQPQFNSLAQKRFPSYLSMFAPSMNVNDYGWKEFNGNMRQLLRMGDRMASAWGIENRCPFLDRRIIEFAFSIPEEWKISGLMTKVILRKILYKRLPNYKDMEKKGLYCSINSWLGKKNKFDKETYIKKQKEICKKFCPSLSYITP